MLMSGKVGRIRDVARESGLSIATISRVMNGSSNVKPETRDKVLRACEKLDYVPNPAARTLSTNRTKIVALIIPSVEHSIFAKYVTAIEQSLSDRGYSLVLAISNANPQDELNAALKLIGMGAEAFILTGADHDSQLPEILTRRDKPFVFTSVWFADRVYPNIGYDNRILAMQAVQYLFKQGHRKIAVVHGYLKESDRTLARCAGARDVADSGEIDFFETSVNVAGGKESAKRILQGSASYSAILCFSDVLALGAYFAITELGLKIPEDVSVMGFDNLDWSEHVVPALTTVDLQAQVMGEKAVTEVIDCLDTSTPITSSKLNARIIERASVGQISVV